ncbi:uncharacterized protein TNCT_336671 [Trichonephila clavata]|uniref:XLR/SYCP3/FAM9 domain-containing protein n=1 Tax=Trichonephila clavata TaxID=2740835 RepID=A0A8X6GSF2_TRICU|nr:uncharacterized protein TNCT_336671 [Trichonephila clavata]
MLKTNLKRTVSGKLKHIKLTSNDLQGYSDVVPNFCLSDITKSIIEGSNNGREYSFDAGMSKLLKRFKADLNEVVTVKKNCMEEFVKDSIKQTTNKVSEAIKVQIEDKGKAVQQFKSEFYSMIQQAAKELKKMKEIEEKIQNLVTLKENEKENERKVYFLQLQEFKRLNDEFCKDMKHLDLSHSKQYSVVLDEMRNDMTQLQKKMLMETQQKEMGNIRKHLKLPLI